MNWAFDCEKLANSVSSERAWAEYLKKGRLSYPGEMDFKGQPFFKRLSGKLEFKTSQFETLKKFSSLSYTRVVRDESEKESEKVGLKLNIQKTKIMASGPITLWEIDGETVQTVTDFIFLGSKIPADGDCCHEIKRCWLLGREVVTKLGY